MDILTNLLQIARTAPILLLPPVVPAALFTALAGISRSSSTGLPTARRVFFSCYAASFAAAIAGVGAMVGYFSWTCTHGVDRICHDGQAGMGLIFLVPAAWGLGSFIGWLWSWFTVRAESSKIYAAGYRYTGEKRGLNTAFIWIVPPAFWVMVGFGLFELFTRAQ